MISRKNKGVNNKTVRTVLFSEVGWGYGQKGHGGASEVQIRGVVMWVFILQKLQICLSRCVIFHNINVKTIYFASRKLGK